MPLPPDWPPRVNSGSVRSIRFFQSGTATANFSDSAYMFINGAGANTYKPLPPVPQPLPLPPLAGSDGKTVVPPNPFGTGQVTPTPPGPDQVSSQTPAPEIWCHSMRICNDDATNPLEFSFDGVNIHGRLLKGEQVLYRFRYECGISVRCIAGSVPFRIEAW